MCRLTVPPRVGRDLRNHVILLPYRYAFHFQVTSDENSATIFDVGLISYKCHTSYLRPCKMWCSVVLCESLGDTHSDSALSCTSLIAWMLLKLLDLQCSLVLQSSA